MIKGSDLVRLFSDMYDDDYYYQKEFSNKYNKELVRDYKRKEIAKEYLKARKYAKNDREALEIAKSNVKGNVPTYFKPGVSRGSNDLNLIINRKGAHPSERLIDDIKWTSDIYKIPKDDVVRLSTIDSRNRRKISGLKRDVKKAVKPVGEYGKKVKNILKKIRIK